MAALTAGGEAPDWFRCGCCGGCCGCWGGCYGGWGGCHGCWGGCYGCWGGCYGCYGCGGCYGGWGGWGRGYAYAAPAYSAPVVMTAYAAPIHPTAVELPPPDSAKIIVNPPADAKLFVDDQPTRSTSALRVFQAPSLERGSSYYYMLRAEVQREGRRYQQTKKVFIHAGDEIRTSFANLGTAQTDQVASQVGR